MKIPFEVFKKAFALFACVAFFCVSPTFSQTAANNEEKQEGFLSLTGGKYLDAIYRGDFQAQNDIAWDYLLKMKEGDQNDLIMGMFISNFGAAFNVAKVDMTVLEEMIVYYLSATSDRSPECFGPGAISKTYTYDHPEIVHEDGSRTPASKTVSTYRYNKEFAPVCDELCERQGTLAMVSGGINFRGKKLDVLELYQGIDEMLNRYSCNGPEIRQFEANIISLHKSEKEQPSNIRRNTFKAAFEAPRALTPLEKIRAADAEFEEMGKRVEARQRQENLNNKYLKEQFMADNKTQEGVVELPSGMQYVMLKTGEGPHPKPEDSITVHQRSFKPDGTLTRSTYEGEGDIEEPTSYVLSSVVYKHIVEGISLLKPGGRIKLFIPSELMFSQYPTMASYANQNPIMVYEYELLSIN